MNREDLYKSFNEIDDRILERSEKAINKKGIRFWLKWGCIAACCCIVVLGIVLKNNIEYVGGFPPTDPDYVYPSVMVQGNLYDWSISHELPALYSLPPNCVYYGEIEQIEGDTPLDDCDFVASFSASGQIYTTEDESIIYLCLTTDWLDEVCVPFTLRE